MLIHKSGDSKVLIYTFVGMLQNPQYRQQLEDML